MLCVATTHLRSVRYETVVAIRLCVWLHASSRIPTCRQAGPGGGAQPRAA